uniref:Uncharacterized protein n=1 Tax=Xiphophorus maculatus TaxID=8083 RepID=A0A3B5QA57_XIPMA
MQRSWRWRPSRRAGPTPRSVDQTLRPDPSPAASLSFREAKGRQTEVEISLCYLCPLCPHNVSFSISSFIQKCLKRTA